METDFFLDNKKRVARKLMKAEDVRLLSEPACYVIENKETNKLYVGSTKNMSHRINSHRQMLNNNIHSNKNLQEEFNNCKDKNNFIVHVCPEKTVEEARDREQLILDEGFTTGILLNISDNSRTPNSGYDRQESIEKMTKSKNTEEYKTKVSQEASERWKDLELRNKMIRSMGQNVTVDGIEYGSVRQASRETGVAVKTIRDRLIDNKCSLDDVRNRKKK